MKQVPVASSGRNGSLLNLQSARQTRAFHQSINAIDSIQDRGAVRMQRGEAA